MRKLRLWRILDKRRFLNAAMEELAGAAHISFEGNLGSLRLTHLPGASEEEAPALKRNTIWPKQNFVVLPLETGHSKAIISAIGGTIPKAILHIQIEREGQLELGIYDNFQGIACGNALGSQFFEQLESDGIMKHTENVEPANE